MSGVATPAKLVTGVAVGVAIEPAVAGATWLTRGVVVDGGVAAPVVGSGVAAFGSVGRDMSAPVLAVWFDTPLGSEVGCAEVAPIKGVSDDAKGAALGSVGCDLLAAVLSIPEPEMDMCCFL